MESLISNYSFLDTIISNTLIEPQKQNQSKPRKSASHRRQYQGQKDSSIANITCHICDKKVHYATTCPDKGKAKDKLKEVKKVSSSKGKKVNKISVKEDNFGGFPESINNVSFYNAGPCDRRKIRLKAFV